MAFVHREEPRDAEVVRVLARLPLEARVLDVGYGAEVPGTSHGSVTAVTR